MSAAQERPPGTADTLARLHAQWRGGRRRVASAGMRKLHPLLAAVVLTAGPLLADGPSDNIPENVRRQPPPGVAIPDDVRAALTARAAAFREKLNAAGFDKAPEKAKWLPDVEVLWKAVDWALRYDEIFDPKQTDWAAQQLDEADKRLEALKKGETPWLSQTGLVVRGYRSRIDDSVQPFGLVVPPTFNVNLPLRWRLDCWFHGRGEKLTELDFIHQRMTSPGEFTPQDTIVLHPYGRYCNGQRFAGETDFFEALETVQRDYRIDDDRIIVRGFSLGGAACWHIAAHHAWRWCAAAPGAGFSETEEFLNFFQGEKLQPTPWERKLWNLYDSTAVAGNFFNLPLVAYSGEIDKQKQAADAMAKALDKEGIALTHIIGPKTAHAYEKGAKAEVNRRIDALAEKGRGAFPLASDFVTYSLKTNRASIGTIDAMAEEWVPARLKSTVVARGDGGEGRILQVTARNVTALTLDLPAGTFLEAQGIAGIVVNTDAAKTGWHANAGRSSDGSLRVSLHVQDDALVSGPLPADGLRKKHGLQGPIDDAFMDRFLFVRPTGTAANEKAGAWAKAEVERAIEHWRRHFRGEALVKNDTDVTEDDMRSANIVVWGDPSSNKLLARCADKLPISWTAGEIRVGEKTFPAANHALAAIYPNPLAPDRYLVLNSSFTFREYDYLNNARQTPKLPDWAVFDLDTPPNSRFAGKVVAGDFFGEKWEVK